MLWWKSNLGEGIGTWFESFTTTAKPLNQLDGVPPFAMDLVVV